MKYVKSNRIATLRFECRKTTILATKYKKKFKPEELASKAKVMNKEILKHYLHITFDKLDLDTSQHIRKVA